MQFTSLEKFYHFLKSDPQRKIYLWGAGIIGQQLGQLLNEQKIPWEGYYDNFSARRTAREKPVFRGADFMPDDSAIYVISTKTFAEIRQQLNNKGIPDNRLVWFDSEDSDSKDIIEEISCADINDRTITDRVKRFHNLHHGQSCFLVGNGPSLRLEDMEKIGKRGFVTLTSNGFFQCYDKTDFRSDYHFRTDLWLYPQPAQARPHILSILAGSKYLFTRANSSWNVFYNDPEMPNIVYFPMINIKSGSAMKFSGDCSKVVYAPGSVSYYMMQMAVYMGFKTIYLIGMDHAYSWEEHPDGSIVRNPEIQDHASMLGESRINGPAHPYRWARAYSAAKDYCDAHGIKMYNATRGGKLEVFPRVNLDDILG